MSLPFGHIRHQGPVLASLGEAVLRSAWANVAGKKSVPVAPGPEVRCTIPAPAPDLVHDFVTRMGGDPASWRSTIPPHLFPHWGFPIAVRAFGALPFPIWRVLNAGCRIVVNAPLPAGKPLEVAGRLESIEQDERRVVLQARITTGTAQTPQALVSDLFAFVPLRGDGSRKKAPETVPSEAHELARWRLPANAGLEFALLTGDFNPIHWVAPWARVAGFPNAILHGFATMARAAEGLVGSRCAGDGSKLRGLDVRFAKPLALPADVGLYVEGERLFVGNGPGAPAYLLGSHSSGDPR